MAETIAAPPPARRSRVPRFLLAVPSWIWYAAFFIVPVVLVIVSALSLHWVNDLPGTLVQIRRILKPDGLFIGVALGGRTLTELRQALLAAEEEARGGAANRVSPLMDVIDAAGLLQRTDDDLQAAPGLQVGVAGGGGAAVRCHGGGAGDEDLGAGSHGA